MNAPGEELGQVYLVIKGTSYRLKRDRSRDRTLLLQKLQNFHTVLAEYAINLNNESGKDEECLITPMKKGITCSCPGFEEWGHCKHVRMISLLTHTLAPQGSPHNERDRDRPVPSRESPGEGGRAALP